MSTKYTAIRTVNSHNSRRRGLCGWVLRKGGKPEMKYYETFQLIRSNDPDAIELPRGVNREVARYARGKYPVPFVGLKQQRKMEGLV